ncbi:MAG TPA: protein kinase [Polyangiaceae bacterium]
MPTCPTCRGTFGDDLSKCPIDGEALLPDAAFTGADVDLAPGTMVGEYRIEGKLGEGGFGAVYRAVHPLIGKTAAIKVLSRQWSSNPQMVSRFISEARAVNQIRHKNIIDIFSFGALPDGRQYYVMELLDGQTFDAFVKDRGRLAPEVALPLLRSVARALDAAHAQGIVHRDLKPENVFLVFDEDGTVQPKLLDFGIAKLLGESTSGHKTRTGAPLGTPSYMSPEQCHGRPVDKRTDVYSLGIMTHEVLTGRLPFDGESLMDILVQHMTAAPPRMNAHCGELPPALDTPVLHMLEKDAQNRPASTGEAIDALVAEAGRAGISVPLVASRNAPALPVARIRSVPPGTTPTAELGRAKTVATPEVAGRTLNPAESDVARGGGRRAILVAALVVGGLGAGAGGVVLLSHPAPRLPVSSEPASASAPVSAGAVSLAPPSAAPVSSTVAVTVETNAPHASVWLAAKRLGDAPGPVSLPRGADKLSLTVKADGYAASSVDVTPTEDVVIAVTLAKSAGPPAPTPSRRVSKDLENPF